MTVIRRIWERFNRLVPNPVCHRYLLDYMANLFAKEIRRDRHSERRGGADVGRTSLGARPSANTRSTSGLKVPSRTMTVSLGILDNEVDHIAGWATTVTLTKEFEFSNPEIARIKAAIQTWDSYSVNADRRWLQPLIETLFSAEAWKSLQTAGLLLTNPIDLGLNDLSLQRGQRQA